MRGKQLEKRMYLESGKQNGNKGSEVKGKEDEREIEENREVTKIKIEGMDVNKEKKIKVGRRGVGQ